MKNAVAYVRVSTDGQVEKYGIESQKLDIQEYADRNGYLIREWFIDEGVSGVLPPNERPELSRLLYDVAQNPPIECVIVYAIDRVARDDVQFYAIFGMLRVRDVELVSVKEPFALSGPVGAMMRAVFVGFAQMERENIKIRTTHGKRVKAYSGGYCGGVTPFGYRSDYLGEMVIEEREAEVVRAIFELRECGYSLRGISDELEMRGMLTRGGGKFTPSTIKSILDNRKTYEGYFRYGKMEWTKGKHEAILEEVG